MAETLRDHSHEILFMDLRTWTENPVKGESKKKVQLVTEQIERAAEIYHTWQNEDTDGSHYEVPELYRSVGKEGNRKAELEPCSEQVYPVHRPRSGN